ncbi:hypothetical protein EPN52_09195 [bacterium]|nr:MAG: hypothetical protein EPN52_09195 [bacterium]
MGSSPSARVAPRLRTRGRCMRGAGAWGLPWLVLIALVVGCAHRGSSSALPPAASSTSHPAAKSARATVVILVPRGTPHLRRPAYVSSATAALSIAINGGAPLAVALTPTSPNCVAATLGLQCTIAVDAPVGQDTFDVTALDQASRALSHTAVPATIVAGQSNALALTLDGVVAQIVVVLPSPSPPEGVATTVPVLVKALDADGYAIVGPGSYANSIVLTDTDPQGTTALSATNVVAPSAAPTLAYNGMPLTTAGAAASIGAAAAGVPASAVTGALFAPAPPHDDWPTFGYDSARHGYNPKEILLTQASVAQLHLSWQFVLSGAADDQPVVAGNVQNVAAGPADVLFVGDERSAFFALNAATGALLWKKQLNSQSVPTCSDMPGGIFGISGSAVIERATNRVYVADGTGQLYAFDMGTGTVAAGWPAGGVAMLPDQNEHIYGALTLDQADHRIYAAFGSHCDISPWRGGIAEVSTSSPGGAAFFYTMGATGGSGGGIWGAGGVALDPRNAANPSAYSDIYALTGNAGTPPSATAFPESLVRVNAALSVVAANAPNYSSADLDFGATPLLFSPANGCTRTLAVGKAKNGQLFVWDADAIGSGPLPNDTLQIGTSSISGYNVGVPAYSPQTGLFYVENGSDSSLTTTGILHGLLAFAVDSQCNIALQWQRTVGPNKVYDSPPAPPSVAGNVVYYADGPNNDVFAFNPQSGAQLWTTKLGGYLFTAPTVVNGRLYVVSFGIGTGGQGTLYAFAP